MNKNFSPKVSVIIPLFNAEKYFAVCLESLAIQTMTDFEVIVVDDCSTDSSLAIAESYIERFGGRLKIITLPQNTGNPAIPRNVGLEQARGEYVYFIDNDDLLIDNALEILCDFATKYAADVVYVDQMFTCGEEPIPQRIDRRLLDEVLTVEVPTLDTDEISGRVEKIFSTYYKWPPWSKFLRRDFLIDNDIKFPRVQIAEDSHWTFKIVCLAKKILRVPTPVYIWRMVKSSVTRRKRSPESELILWLNPLIVALDDLDKFLRGLEYFRQNPAVRLKVLNLFTGFQLYKMSTALNALTPPEVYEILLREFSKANLTPALNACLIANIIYRNELI